MMFGLGGEVHQQRGVADALVEHDVELGLPERRRDLVLDHLHPHVVADDRLALLDRADAADVEPERGVELERLAAGGGLGVAEHDADLLAQLVDEDHGAVGAVDGAGQLAERLAHEPGLEAHVAVAHLALDFGLGHQGRDRVDDHDVHRAGAHQDLDDLERLLAGVGLGDQQVLDVDAELLGVLDVERVLGVDVGGDAARLLHVGGEVEGERGLAGGLGAVDLGDAAAGDAADAGGGVEVDGAGGNGGHLDPGRLGCPSA